MISGSGGLEVAVTNVTNIVNNNSTTKGGDTNVTSTNVFADNSGGRGEQTGMLGAS